MQLRVQQVNTLSIPHPNLHTNNSILKLKNLKIEMEPFFGMQEEFAADDGTLGRCTFGQSGRDGCFAD